MNINYSHIENIQGINLYYKAILLNVKSWADIWWRPSCKEAKMKNFWVWLMISKVKYWQYDNLLLVLNERIVSQKSNM